MCRLATGFTPLDPRNREPLDLRFFVVKAFVAELGGPLGLPGVKQIIESSRNLLDETRADLLVPWSQCRPEWANSQLQLRLGGVVYEPIGVDLSGARGGINCLNLAHQG